MTKKRTFVNARPVRLLFPWSLATFTTLHLVSGAAALGEVPHWSRLLAPLTTARENGTAELLATASWLEAELQQAGWEVATQWYQAYPYEQRALGLLLLLGGSVYAVCMWTRRFGTATCLALLLPLLVVLQMELRVPLTWFLAFRQPNVAARLPNPEAKELLLFSAHFDTKTDLLDHVARAPILAFAAPAVVIMAAIAAGSFVAHQAGNLSPGRATLARIAGWMGVLYGAALAAVFTGGALRAQRSPGALDDGAACAVLVRLAHELAAAAPRAVEVQLVFFSGEELAVQGATAFLRAWDPPPGRTLRLVNLDPIGASADLQVLGSERAFLRGYAPSTEVVGLLDRAHRKLRGSSLPVAEVVGLTDAWTWLRHGYRAATLLSAVPPFVIPRGLHSVEDNGNRVDLPSLDFALQLLRTVVAIADEEAGGAAARGAETSARRDPSSLKEARVWIAGA